MDVFEHAYILDYGLKRADYIEEFSRILAGKRPRSIGNKRDRVARSN
jgi:hypothetical protein